MKKSDALKIAIVALLIVLLSILTLITVILGKKTRAKILSERTILRQVVSVDSEDESDEDESINFVTCYKNDFIVENQDDASSKISCYVGNSAENVYDDMYFELYADGPSGSELIYKSGTIPRGKYVDTIETAKCSLDPGFYEGKLVHYILNDNGRKVKSVSVTANIIVR